MRRRSGSLREPTHENYENENDGADTEDGRDGCDEQAGPDPDEACRAIYDFVEKHVAYETRMLLIHQGYGTREGAPDETPGGGPCLALELRPYEECTQYQNERLGVFFFLGPHLAEAAEIAADTLRSVLHRGLGEATAENAPATLYEVAVHDIGEQPHIEARLAWRAIFEALEGGGGDDSHAESHRRQRQNVPVQEGADGLEERARQARAVLHERIRRAQGYGRRSCRQCVGAAMLALVALLLAFVFLHAVLVPYAHRQARASEKGGPPLAAFESLPASWRAAGLEMRPSCTLAHMLLNVLPSTHIEQFVQDACGLAPFEASATRGGPILADATAGPERPQDGP